jgi:hypothetical protein
MEEETDQLKALKQDEREDLSWGYVSLNGLEQVRAHQRGENVGIKSKRRPKGYAKITPELREAILATEGSQVEVGKRFGVSDSTVAKLRQAARRK